eukprot:3836944-Lingulodinium_polyedra.AAC.1
MDFRARSIRSTCLSVQLDRCYLSAAVLDKPADVDVHATAHTPVHATLRTVVCATNTQPRGAPS